MRAVATVCSKEKRQDPAPLRAVDRYLGKHIRYVEFVAHGMCCPFFILSGKFGLIRGSYPIEYYDYYLEPSSVYSLAKLLEAQLRANAISQLDLYVEDKPTWQPYRDAMRLAAQATGVTLRELHIETASIS